MQATTDHPEHRTGFLRRLELIGVRGTFLRRRGINLGLFGIYIHSLDAPDPGLDLHDHPWWFASLVLRGGYTDEQCDTRDACEWAAEAESLPGRLRGVPHTWRRWSLHTMPLHIAHRITHVEPDTVTLVFRGRRRRRWGFYTPQGWFDEAVYDNDRRQATEVHR